MFRAKQRGTGWEMAESTSGVAPSKRLDIQAEMRRALERSEFRLHYQPQVNLSARRVAGVEALLRWEHPQRGLVAPAEFIPEAEESGLIVMIGEWVIEESCRQLASWRQAGACDEDLLMSVNLSARQLGDRRLLDVVQNSLDRHEHFPGPAVPRDHREHRLGQPRARQSHAAPDQGTRDDARARRFRHRPLVAGDAR